MFIFREQKEEEKRELKKRYLGLIYSLEKIEVIGLGE